MTKVTYPSVLAFERKFDCSDLYFFQKRVGSDESPSPISLTEKTVLGTISHKSAKENDKRSANIQRVDVAKLDNDKDSLVAKWNFKVLPFNGKPWSCNEPEFQKKLMALVEEYLADETNLSALTDRYAYNIINGRWLWRNRVSARNIQLEIYQDGESDPFITIEDVKDYPLLQFLKDENVEHLSRVIAQGLKGEQFVNLKVVATAYIGEGHEVYPSQEFVQDASSAKGAKSKVLYSTNDTAGMHSQKVGNAIRTIDTWYMDDAQFPIAVEPFGTVSTMGEAFRAKNHFYKFFEDWIVKDKEISLDEKHFVIANLIRGGVFGGKS
ncbi:type I-F CRISPR-associated protein Csy3 [Ignatzschineria cameli]|uniref:Type I-F CRISPR-associated protein Csy3 n=1 Tax=Ignatzschineria cameli TaxID=2182793 RepID=A0A2U2ATF9_9GAMM|nr:type I-F CRISPR-associated protein Csy3 [Ignatzschineria cameli]PWD87534.1 type I-F CRISPR-associated protein Csy3 [Ignatzschineria cameli]PWD87966.1 type I-F CRISPR-associated protein Csy3 [Ignatzschineria cameli]PWD90540.1 type I-F CRISPR-associated protein Csy3 [Ignatzschineria cameli]PWD92424.1 type I-F CRISPR-associated protein Csy3 [Ignatzschineria cameli]PWD93217.1 type I-F CRISPR-associated protein Csy3 [Ignatzschineria cameli]